jgi:hypothetical protein
MVGVREVHGVGVLDGFFSTWSNAKATFGEGTPQGGAQFDGSGALNQLKSNLDSAERLHARGLNDASALEWRKQAYDAGVTGLSALGGPVGGPAIEVFGHAMSTI